MPVTANSEAVTPEDLAALVDDLRHVARADAGKFDLRPENMGAWKAADAITSLSRELEEARELCAALRISKAALNRALADEVLRHQAGRATAQEWATARQALIALEIAATKQNPLRDEIAASITRLAAAECSLRDVVAPSTKGGGR